MRLNHTSRSRGRPGGRWLALHLGPGGRSPRPTYRAAAATGPGQARRDGCLNECLMRHTIW